MGCISHAYPFTWNMRWNTVSLKIVPKTNLILRTVFKYASFLLFDLLLQPINIWGQELTSLKYAKWDYSWTSKK